MLFIALCVSSIILTHQHNVSDLRKKELVIKESFNTL